MREEDHLISATGPARSTGGLDAADVWALRWVYPELPVTVLAAEPKVIGRDPSCDVVLEDADVSRRHCEVVLGMAPRVADLGSRNGIRVNGTKVSQYTLEDGSVLRVGRAIAVVVRAPELEALELPVSPLIDTGYLGSAKLRDSVRRIEQFAERDESILITGESGTGKEELAHHAHRVSRRKGQFIPVNGSTLRGDLAAATLFGHEKGAFTGATTARKGVIRAADRGTLFLDEVGELPLDVQPMLLRCLEQREVTPVGGERAESVTARFVFATHRDLEERIGTGDFREDLYHRIATHHVALPALRQRREDILALFCHLSGRRPSEISAGFVERLLLRTWNGNVRALSNVVKSLAVLAPAPALLIGRHLDACPTSGPQHPEPTPSVAPRELSRDEWKALFDKHGGVAASISRETGMSVSAVKRYIEEFRPAKAKP